MCALNVFRYWGKTANTGAFHLLPYHCLDVAAVGWYLLDPAKPLCDRIAKNLCVEPGCLRNWFAFCLSLHDLGKFSISFQGLVPHSSDFLIIPNPEMPYSERHDTLGFLLWRDFLNSAWLQKGSFGFAPDHPDLKKLLRAFDPWMEVVTGHHGVPPKYLTLRAQRFFTAYDEQAAFDYCQLAANHFLQGMDLTPFAEKSFKKRLRYQSWLFAGIMVLADWLGSSISPSDYCSRPDDLVSYWEQRALPAASAILKEVNLGSPTISTFSGIGQLFPFIHTPTPLQEWAATVELSDGAQLFVLEDVTGSGKTEAAISLTHRLMASGLAEGLYVALPTMATANGMYQRLGKAYRRLFSENFRPSLVLAHGARHLSDDFRASIPVPAASDQKKIYGQKEESGESYCSAWFADSRKKALLAEVGVGTIDQALLAVLPARHQSLRLLGLSNKILLVDEVHAYDPYMNTLLQVLLEAHARNGGSAILLSATLPQEMRENYVRAFCTGASYSIPELDQNSPYPLATHVSRVLSVETKVPPRKESEREVSVDFLTGFHQVREVARKAVEDGKCVCWIRNTVADARAAYDLFVDSEWIDQKRLDLFHSRFAMVDRQEIEEKTLSLFGEASSANERCGRVLIATQVIEQSLDLDFDVMISDLAPVDLLVQRAGRLHRHTRDALGNRLRETSASDERGIPVLHIFGPQPTDAPPKGWLKSVLPGTQAIYQNVGQVWLTQKRLSEVRSIRTPVDARFLIEGVYGPAAQDAIPETLQEISSNSEGKDSGERGMARLNALNLSKGYSRSSSEDADGWAEETQIPTRLSEETITVAMACLVGEELKPYAQEGNFPWELSMLNLPQSEWRKAAEMIPECLAHKINHLKETEPVLKWAEILPLTPAIQVCYDARCGWKFEKEGNG